MVKMSYVTIAVVAALALLIVGIAVYEFGAIPGMNNGMNATVTPSPQENDSGSFVSKPISAFQALSIADNNPDVKKLKSSNTNSYVTDICSEMTAGGLSETWIIMYNLDSQQAYVRVSNGVVSDINTTSGAIHSPKMTMTGIIDSDKANSIAIDTLPYANKMVTGSIAMEMMAGDQNTPIWDIIYRVQDGNYLVRLNAMNGSVIGSNELTND